MPLSTLPLIAWGTADDISAYTASGTPTETSGVTDPFGGTSAYTIGDDDGAASEYEYKVVTLTTNGTQYLAIFAKAGTATVSEVDLFDQTATVLRGGLRLTWSGAVPTGTIYGGSGTVYGAIDCGASWYLILWSADNAVAANTNRLRIFGAQATAASTGNTSYYMRNVVALDYLDVAVATSMLRTGSMVGQTQSGTEDAFVAGRDYLLNGQARWIPLVPKASPVITSGWAGANESTGINCGVHAMLYAGMSRNALTWVPNRAACTTSVSCYLQRPETDADIGLESNGSPDRTFPLRLRSTAVFAGI